MLVIAVGGELSVDVVQHPDVAGLLRHGQHKFVLGERKPDRSLSTVESLSAGFEFGHLKRLADWLSRSRIEADPPDIEEAAAAGYEVDGFSIRRPARLIVPVLAVGDACPRYHPARVRRTARIPSSENSRQRRRQSIGRQEKVRVW